MKALRLDETLSETDKINLDIRAILDVTTIEWGVQVTLVELKDIQLPDSMKRAMARQAEAEREKRAKIIAAEGESLAAAALGDASDTMMAHPLALQLRNLQTLVELGVDKNTTVVFPSAVDVDHHRTRCLPREGRRRGDPARAAPDDPHPGRGDQRNLRHRWLAMIVALMFMALIGWGCWWIFHDGRSLLTTPMDAAPRRATENWTPLGVEDDSDQWPAIRGPWTALDERQLTRLLMESVHVDRPATNTVDDAIAPIEDEDTL